MDDKPHEQMTDTELAEFTDQVISEHESGAATFRSRYEAVRVVGTVPISLRIRGAHEGRCGRAPHALPALDKDVA